MHFNPALRIANPLLTTPIMRDGLKKFDWHTYGLRCDDLEYVEQIIDKILEERKSLHSKKMAQYANHEEAGEIISDLSFYFYEENQLLNHFLLWRLQGIFEGLLKQKYFPDKRFLGLRSKLEFARSKGAEITDDDFNDLVEWGMLRNALSHFPPEQYRSGPLTREDITDYTSLLKRVLTTLEMCK